MQLLPIALVLTLTSQPIYDQGGDPRQFYEAGKYQEAVETANAQENAPPEHLYFGGLAALKQNRPDEARQLFERLAQSRDGDPWGKVGASAAAQASGNLEAALQAATEAAQQGSGLSYAHYQLGLVRAQMEDHSGAAEAFERAASIEPNFAYAHYHAGLENSKLKHLDKMATHFEYFLKLAPQAPERPGVASIMQTMRGR